MIDMSVDGMSETEKAVARLSELAQRVIQLAVRVKAGGMRLARLGHKVDHGSMPLPAVLPGNDGA